LREEGHSSIPSTVILSDSLDFSREVGVKISVRDSDRRSSAVKAFFPFFFCFLLPFFSPFVYFSEGEIFFFFSAEEIFKEGLAVSPIHLHFLSLKGEGYFS